jgi:glycosyltransferase involved in cell wall biosynthesis
VLAGLPDLGFDVVEHRVPGPWPRDGSADVERVLRGVPDDAAVLLDGLVACGVPAALAPHADRLRLAVLVHLPLGDEAGLPTAVARDRDQRERTALHHAGTVLTTSRWTADRVVRRHGLDPTRVHVAPPGVDPAPVAPGSAVTGRPPRLFCLGALTPTKGQDLLVAALARITDRPWTAVLGGPHTRDPGFVVRLRAAIARHGLADRVAVPGTLTGRTLENHWAAADLLVLPSRTETFGMVVSEALARGIPVVASRVGGVPEALDSSGPTPGTWVSAENVGALAATLYRWLEDPLLRSGWKLSALGRRGTLAPWTSTSRRIAWTFRSPAPA